jgi:acetyl-CoA acetyltransferase
VGSFFSLLHTWRRQADCGVEYAAVEAAVVGSAFSTGMGQRCLYEMGMTGIPIFNVANACATGSNALYLCRSFVAGGQHECCLALGIEIMKPGPLGASDATKGPKGPPKAGMMDGAIKAMQSKFPIVKSPLNPQMFGNAGREHMARFGSRPTHFAAVGEKNHRHSANNPYSQVRDVYTRGQIEQSRMIHAPITKLQCSPTSDGAAAAIVCSEAFVIAHGLEAQAVEILAQSMKTDLPSAHRGGEWNSCINAVGFGMAKAAADELYARTGLGPNDVQVVELHDCFSCNELLTYEAIGLAKEGEGHKLVDSGDNTFGGKWVVNPSGGLISKGHPLGATGVAQCCELNWQLRGECGPRQVPNATVGLQHNLGLGGNVVMTMYRRPEEWRGRAPRPGKPASGAMGFPDMRARL